MLRCASPGGTAESNAECIVRDAEAQSISRPFGTGLALACDPALKRWAIIVCPFGTTDWVRRYGNIWQSISMLHINQKESWTTRSWIWPLQRPK